jgi:CRP/FNR family cyclic AMP-dependent transcriptional regulator
MASLSSPFAPAAFLRNPSRPHIQFLSMQPWFAGLGEAMQARILDQATTLQGAKGEVLLHAGEEVKGWYAVLTGLVKLQTQSRDGKRQSFLGIPGGEWFGEGSVMRAGPRYYDVVAIRDSELLCLPRDVFEELRATDLVFNQTLAEHLNMRLGQALAVIETQRLNTPEQRIAMYLGPLLWHGPRRLSLSQEELGMIAGLSRQTVNKVLQDFERQKLVSLEFGRIAILDEPGIAAVARGG